MDTLVGSGDVTRITGVKPKLLTNWVESGVIRPVKQGTGRGRHHAFSVFDVLKVSLAIDMRRRGLGVDQIARVVEWLQAKSMEDLLGEFSRGRKMLMVVGSCPPWPRLWRRSDIFENDEIDLQAAFDLGVPVAIIDVERAYHTVYEKLVEGLDR